MEQLREEVRELREMLETVLEHTSKIHRLESRLSESLFKNVDKKDLNTLRRRIYQEKKEAKLKGRLEMPEFQILQKRDRRLLEKAGAWADRRRRLGGNLSSTIVRFAAQIFRRSTYAHEAPPPTGWK